MFAEWDKDYYSSTVSIGMQHPGLGADGTEIPVFCVAIKNDSLAASVLVDAGKGRDGVEAVLATSIIPKPLLTGIALEGKRLVEICESFLTSLGGYAWGTSHNCWPAPLFLLCSST